jgi:glycosyltransferase involved in cell wall biosynthesis
VGAYTAELARALSEAGATVSVLTTRAAEATAEAERAPRSPQAPVRVSRIASWGPAIWELGARHARTMGAEWIHVQYQTAAYAMNPAINFAPERWQRAGLRVAWSYHDLLPPYLFPKAGARLRGWVTRRPAQNAALTIVTNESDRVELARHGIQAYAIPIGSNIPALRLSAEERTSLRIRYGIPPAAPLVGYFGFLNRSKGAPTLLRSLRRLVDAGVDAHLLLIGEGLGASDPTNRATQAEVHALIAELGVGERVRETGPLGDAEVAAALNAVDLLVLPFEDGASLRRGTLMAGLANGCAIVTTPPQAPLPELEVGTALLTAPAGDDAAFAAAMRRVLDDAALATRLREGAHTVSAHFAWESIARRHLALYDAVATGRR